MTRYGYLPDAPDDRDLQLQLEAPAAIPPRVDHRLGLPQAWDQGQLGSCTAHAIAGAVLFAQLAEHEKAVLGSRLFIYYREREIEGTIGQDAGAQIRDGMKVAAAGVPPEPLWPYDITKFKTKPPQKAVDAAAKYKAAAYKRVARTHIREALAAGFPVVFGFTVYESFESQQVAWSGRVDLPAPGEKIVGGHAVLAVGYDDDTQRFIVRNSWGTKWGDTGHFTIPYAYLQSTSLASDFWTVTKES